MAGRILSSGVTRSGLLLDPELFGTEDMFVHSTISGAIDNFSIGNGKYMKFESWKHLGECRKKLEAKNNGKLCTYVIFDGVFKLEVAYKEGLLFYASVEKYSTRDAKNIFMDDAGLFSKFWDKEDGFFAIGSLSCYVQSNQLFSMTQNN